jgi:hypothetical protein
MLAPTSWLSPPAIYPPPKKRSFQGFTCLMQVSTRTQDWLVDALALRGELGAALGPVFSDPGVVKVLHGADHDVLWLQVGGKVVAWVAGSPKSCPEKAALRPRRRLRAAP